MELLTLISLPQFNLKRYCKVEKFALHFKHQKVKRAILTACCQATAHTARPMQIKELSPRVSKFSFQKLFWRKTHPNHIYSLFFLKVGTRIAVCEIIINTLDCGKKPKKA